MEISVQEVAEILKNPNGVRIIDVREPWERETASIEGTELLTQESLEELIQKGDRAAPIVFYCHHGMRSLNAAMFFAQQGFTNVKSMRGGINQWSIEIDPDVPMY
jgi:rhodanese-related sulfurtransferase